MAATERTSQRAKRAIGHSDVRAADLQEELAERRLSVPLAPTKTAATERTSQRAKRAIGHSALCVSSAKRDELVRSRELRARLTDAVQQGREPRRGNVERLAAPNPVELDGP